MFKYLLQQCVAAGTALPVLHGDQLQPLSPTSCCAVWFGTVSTTAPHCCP